MGMGYRHGMSSGHGDEQRAGGVGGGRWMVVASDNAAKPAVLVDVLEAIR